MCEWGDTVALRLPVAAHLSHTGEARVADKAVDRCIVLADGRELSVSPSPSPQPETPNP